MSLPEQPGTTLPPTQDDIEKGLAANGHLMTADREQFMACLDEIAPVYARFTVRHAPVRMGGAPLGIQEKWIGLSLPIRARLQPIATVPILAREAIRAVGKRDPIAQSWWRTHFIDEAQRGMPNTRAEHFREFLINSRFLIFAWEDGEFQRL